MKFPFREFEDFCLDVDDFLNDSGTNEDNTSTVIGSHVITTFFEQNEDIQRDTPSAKKDFPHAAKINEEIEKQNNSFKEQTEKTDLEDINIDQH